MTALGVALAAAVLVLAFLVAGLLRSHAEILRALHELGAGLELDRGAPGPQPLVLEPFAPVRPAAGGSDVPDSVVGTTLDDEAVALSLRGGGDTLLAFLSSGCGTCQGFWQDFSSGVDDVPGGARLVVVTQGLVDESESALRDRAPAGVPLVLSSQTWAEFSVPGSPYFVYVDGASGSVLGEGSAATWEQVVDLLGQARADGRAASERATRVAGGGRHRRDRDDAALAAAGIVPGDPSLWTAPSPGAERTGRAR